MTAERIAESTSTLAEAEGMLEFIDASPSPYHACAEVAARLEKAGFQELSELDAWTGQVVGGRFIRRGGTLVAWYVPEGWKPELGFRILGAHTDSPNLRIKPQPEATRAGFRQLGVEIYGGVLLNAWLDRDLGLSGRVLLRGDGEPESRLFLVQRPVLRVPQLAIHLNREVNEGFKLNKQRHMPPVWSADVGDTRTFRELLGQELDVDPSSILAWDAMCHDVNPSSIIGWERDMISAPRLDNLCSTYVGLRGMLDALASGDAPTAAPVVSFFDHEEVGSASRAGADGPVLRDILERVALTTADANREDFHRAVAASVCVSADMAHATHPNYIEKHDAEHHLALNAGPVIKLNANQRYASEGETEALFQMCCEEAGSPYQKWVNRTDLGCGSTIGPMTASQLGIRTVDVGLAQLAMHSSRELCGSRDPWAMVRVLETFFRR